MIDFSPYQLHDYDKSRENELIGLLCKCYSEFGEKGEYIELNDLDTDLLKINEVYAQPSCFKILIDPESNQLIGTCALKIKSNAQGELEADMKRVFLAKEYRGKGLGKKLSEWTFEYAKEQNCKVMHIWSGTFCHDAHKLYKALGAQDTEECRSIGGLTDIHEYHFIKELA